MRSRTLRSLRRCTPWVLAVAACCLAGLTPRRLAADDRGLLRFDSAKPYLFILLDNSGSMASIPGDAVAPANGDDPTSKLASAKSVLYDVFSSASDIQLGLGTFNQDNLRVRGKHWLYTAAAGTTAAVSASLPVAWPADGEQWVFGTFFPALTKDVSGALTVPTPGTLGTALAGVSLTTYKAQLDRFAKLQVNDDNGNLLADASDSSQDTVLYVTASGKTYQYTLSRQKNNPNLGNPTITVQATVRLCTLGICAGAPSTANLTFNLVSAFLMLEGPGNQASQSVDNQTGVWNYSDVLQSWQGQSNKQFSGGGIEGNYDGTFTNPPLPQTGVQARGTDNGATTGYDPYGTGSECAQIGTGTSSSLCTQNLKYPTTIAPPIPGLNVSTAALDSGDLLPLNWNDTNQAALLTRLAPNQASATPDFGQANYFVDIPVVDPVSGKVRLALKDPGQIPLLAAGPTPLGNAIIDYRCWYLGDKGGGSKCNNVGNYTTSWSDLAASADTSWGCRKPYLIIISDGNDTTGGPDPTADVANLHSKAGVQTWVIAYGAPVDAQGNCNPGHPLDSIVHAGKGELVCPNNPADLKAALLAILGQIREQTREFASAAVPSVQATVADKIYLSDFTPAISEAVWEGHVNAFLKPLPLNPATGKPDTSKLCSGLAANKQSSCFLWDGGAQLVKQVPASAPLVGDTPNLRRIYYSMFTAAGSWAASRRPLQTITDNTFTTQPIRYDLWRGFRIIFQPDSPKADPTALATLNNVIAGGPCTAASPGPPCGVETTRTHTFTDPVTGVTSTDTYILGDVFHSNPLIVGTPTNTRFFAMNLNANNGTCAADAGMSTDTGYRCFETRQANRRKLLLVGSNDGMVHAFDAGQPHSAISGSTTTVSFDNGSGSEVWAYMPRSVMPTVKDIANGTQQHWTVDGPIQGADVFIDPAQSGTPDPTKREWRSVVIAGLREGPETGGINGYYALDITQPDTLSLSNGVYVPQPVGGTALPTGGTAVPFTVPSCDGLGSSAPSSCGRIPYPSPLWEFYDQAHNADGSTALDTRGNPVLVHEGALGTTDLGHTWSMPAIGRIQIADASGKTIDKYVAVFGGGLDASTKTLEAPNAGNWLYIVDVETGKAIYKRPLKGCAASGAAAVDIDQVGLITRIYMGTTTGHMYRVDVGPNANGHLPQLQSVSVLGTDGQHYTEQRITTDPDNTSQVAWAPREIFNANYNGSTLSTTPRSIYYRPSVIFVARLGLYALAFGTGDREDLWSGDPQAQRYYLFVDDTDLLSPSALPLNESAFTALAVSSPNTSTDILENGSIGHRGWFLTLSIVTDSSSGTPVNFTERVITDAFALTGINTFSTFQPDICFNIDPNTLKCVNGNNGTCSKGGTSRIFVTFTTNANTVLVDAVGNAIRYYNAATFVTPPYAEQSQTKNPSPGTPSPPGTTADQLTPQLTSVMNSLKALFPHNCRFGNYRIDIKAVSGDTGIIFIAPVPICIVEKNWKEF